MVVVVVMGTVVDRSIRVVVGGMVAGTKTGSSSPPPHALMMSKENPPSRNLTIFNLITRA